MRNTMCRPLVIAAILLMPIQAHAASEPIELKRSGKWQLEYDVDSCHLLAQFGQGDDALVANFTRYQPGDEFELRLYGRPLKISGQDLPATVDFAPTGNPRKTSVLLGRAHGLPMVILNNQYLDDRRPGSTIPKLSVSDEAHVDAVTITLPGKRLYRLQFGPIDAAMAAMRTCSDDLVKSWGYDPGIIANLASYPHPLNNPETWLRTDDYPSAQLQKGGSGLVQFRLDVDEAGSTVGCRILNTTGAPEFAATTCKNLSRRARFSPAIDAAGKPTRAFFVASVKWLARGR